MALSLIWGFVMKQISRLGSLRCVVLLILSTSLIVKGVQFAFIVAISQSNGASVEALAFAVSSVYGAASSETSINGCDESQDYLMGSFEADRGLRVFASVFLFIWLVVGAVALISIILNGLMLVLMINIVVYTLGLGVESLLVAVLTPVHGGDSGWTTVGVSLYTFFPLFVDSLTTIALIIYSCWHTRAGMSFDPQEYQLGEKTHSRKHKASVSSTFHRFDTVDSSP